MNKQDRNTILAALRLYQSNGYADPTQRPDWLHDIATDMDNDTSLDDQGIDDLCHRINSVDRCPDCDVEYSDDEQLYCPCCARSRQESIISDSDIIRGVLRDALVELKCFDTSEVVFQMGALATEVSLYCAPNELVGVRTMLAAIEQGCQAHRQEN